MGVWTTREVPKAETINEMIIVFRYLIDSQVVWRDFCSISTQREELESVRDALGDRLLPGIRKNFPIMNYYLWSLYCQAVF